MKVKQQRKKHKMLYFGDTSQLELVVELQCLCRSFFFLVVDHKVRIVDFRPELVAGEDVERECGKLWCDNASPEVPVRGDGLEGEEHDSGEVNVGYDHDVVLPEQSQLHQIHRGLPVGLGGVTEVLDRPDDRKQHGAATHHVDEEENLLPREPLLAERAGLIDHDLSNVGDDLQRDHDHQNLLLLVLQVRLQERPAGSDQDDESEERYSFQEAEDVEQHVPAVGASGPLDVRLVLGFAGQVHSLENHHREHEEMDSENGESFLVEDEDPNPGEREVNEREEEENPREDGFTGGEVITYVALAIEIVHHWSDGHGDLQAWNAVREEKRVLIRVGLRVDRSSRSAVRVRRALFDRSEGKDFLDEVWRESAVDLALLDLLNDLVPRLLRAKEESDIGEVWIVAWEFNRRRVELEDALVGESELV